MADEARYSDEIRIPISFTLPWSGWFTPNGHPWPIDAKGREWPSDNRGDPEFPIDLLPKGFAPGTSSVYHEGDGRRITERFAAMDAAMFDEGRRAGERARRARADGPAGHSPMQLVADDGRKTKGAIPSLSTSHFGGAATESTPAWPSGSAMSNQEAFDKGIASSPRDGAIRIPQDANSHLTRVPLVDSSGNAIKDATGAAAATPKAFSAEFFYQRGREDAHLYDRAIELWKALKPMAENAPDHDLTPENLAGATGARSIIDAAMELRRLPISRFGQQAEWDAQRYNSPGLMEQFRSAASIYIGIYAAAAGIPRDMIQDIQNDYAALYSDFGNQPRDQTYHHLAKANVENVDLGYNLVLQQKVR